MIINKQKIYETKITCFTVNIFDNGYYKDGLPADKISREKLKTNINRFGNFFDFKIYDYNHPLVIECKEKYKEFFDREEIWLPIKADVVRLYILSKLPYHLYIDDDVVICQGFLIDDLSKPFFSIHDHFCCIYNGRNLDIFKEMLEVYPFEDKQLGKLENLTKEEYIHNINHKRIDNYLIDKKYNYLSKFIKKIKINHYDKFRILNISDTKRDIIITRNENFDYSYKDGLCFIELCKKDKPYDYYNYFHFCVNEKYYTKEELIEMYKETGMVDKIVEENGYTKIILKK